MQNLIVFLFLFTGILLLTNCAAPGPEINPSPENFVLDYTTPCDPGLQRQLETIDAGLREKYGMTTAQTAVGVLDLHSLRLAMIHPDRIEYAASVPKVGILLAYFALNPGAETNLDAATRHELGLMAKISSNEAAAKFSQQLGLTNIQRVLNSYGFYDASHGGGIWVGKHYGKSTERIGDPVGDKAYRQRLGAWVGHLTRVFPLTHLAVVSRGILGGATDGPFLVSLGVVVRDFGGIEYLQHDAGSLRRDELALLEQPEEPEQLADGGGVGSCNTA